MKNRSKKFGGGVLASLPKILFVAVLLFSSSLAFAKDKDLQNMSDENLNKILQGLGVPMDAKTLKALDAEMEDEEEESGDFSAEEFLGNYMKDLFRKDGIDPDAKKQEITLPKNLKLVYRRDRNIYTVIKIGEKYCAESREDGDSDAREQVFYKKNGKSYTGTKKVLTNAESSGRRDWVPEYDWETFELEFVSNDEKFRDEIFKIEQFFWPGSLSKPKNQRTKKIAGRLCTEYKDGGDFQSEDSYWIDNETGLALDMSGADYKVIEFDTKVKSFGKIELPPKW